jgi:glycerol kinase
MRSDWPEAKEALKVLRADGGMANSDWTMQRLADLTDCSVDRPQITETTALGAAYLAGLRAGFFAEPDRFSTQWRLQRRFTPQMDAVTRKRKLASWASAVHRLLS